MTPAEIFEYKLAWRPGYCRRVHSDLKSRAVQFCKDNFEQHEWYMTEWVGIYEHAFHFEKNENAELFAKQWPLYVRR